MKVVLIKDVARLGRCHEIKDVPDGLAQNYLIPRGFVLPASPENIKKAQAITSHRITQQSKDKDSFKRVVEQLGGISELVIKATANPQGGLFKGIHASDIATAITKEIGKITESEVLLPHPIKTAGKHRIDLERGGVSGQVTVNILAV